MDDSANLHGTCIALGEVGVLLRGPAGAGKSDLALRLIEDGARLVADDRVEIARRGDAVTARAPDALAGLLEVRGLGIVRLAPERVCATVPLRLVVDLMPGAEIERLPGPRHAAILGLHLDLVAVDPFTVSAPAKVRLAAGAGPGSIMPTP
jgi:HPr kinase/phosphorylase